jgi:hypothetical protein
MGKVVDVDVLLPVEVAEAGAMTRVVTATKRAKSSALIASRDARHVVMFQQLVSTAGCRKAEGGRRDRR